MSTMPRKSDLRERPEDDDVVDAVQKLRPQERSAARRAGRRAALRGLRASRTASASVSRMRLRPDVARHDDDGVREVRRAPASVGEAPVVEHLEEQVEDVGVRLLDLVEEEHAVRLAADGLGQKSALFAVDVTRRRADEALRHVLFHELAHVEASHRLLVVEQELARAPSRAPSCRRRSVRGTETTRWACPDRAAPRDRGAPRATPRAPPRLARRRARRAAPPS